MSHPKVSTAEVRDRFDTSLTDSQLQGFIDDAHLFITDLLGGKGLTEDRLQLIERYFAAGLAERRDPRAEQIRGAATSETLQQESYLETALKLDTTGTLRQHFGDKEKRQAVLSVRAGPQDTLPSVSDES